MHHRPHGPRRERLASLLVSLFVTCLLGTVALVAASCGGAGDASDLLRDGSAQGDGPQFNVNDGTCTPRTCQAAGYTCGMNADGCGNLVDCGSCSGADFCGGGGFSRCGTGDGGATTPDGGSCTPKACVDLGYTCGKNADGCGGVVDCGSCAAPAFCGGGGFSVCGAPDGGGGGGGIAACVPATCPSLGFACGMAGDGCGNLLDCGSCAAPAFCGGGGFSACGGTGGGTRVACTPRTCASLGDNCGPAGDGCGNLLQCGSCGGPDICGGGGTPGVCGHNCTGLCTQQMACPGAPTTLTGRVLAGVSSWVPAGTSPDPVPNAIVYIPSSPIQPFKAGAQCTQCGADVSGDPLVSTTSAFDGTFTLTNVPVGTHIPIVVQLGRWRREVFFDVTSACASTAIGDLHLPRDESEGDIPLTAISTGAVDSLECILLKMGVDETEFDGTMNGGSGRIHLYSAGFATADANGHGSGASLFDSLPESSLLGTGGSYMNYDQIMLPCWGDEFLKTNDELADLVTYANGGGRFFATHFSYTWLFQNSPFDATASWDVNANRNSTANGGAGVPFTGDIDVSGNPKGAVFEKWLNLLGALSQTSPPQVTIQAGRHDVDAVSGSSIDWIDGTDPSPPSASHAGMLLHYTFDTPVGAGQAAQCGHAIFSDFHVNNQGSTNSSVFPDECQVAPLSPQERILEYMIWDLQSCVPGPPQTTCAPRTCAQQSLGCGPAGDGCGNVIDCGACPSGQSCGGGGVAGQCGAPPPGSSCTPKTCSAQNIGCGPAGDGCGNALDCGQCVPPQTCGGGGVAGQCGSGDAGARCVPETCASQHVECGPAGDGCGDLLQCGACTGSSVCGGGGLPGVCGPPGTCVPASCAAQSLQCGPAGDGCGGVLQCGQCASGTCGAGGFARCGVAPK
ncbi:MAG TPA: hypothetical protein VHV30_04965 [Polyangiaceae bacterium]|jgi:hypothetical protein|nr:hypothetical protein [Polyangiaceae bacterium]